jgi:hypothetical protein
MPEFPKKKVIMEFRRKIGEKIAGKSLEFRPIGRNSGDLNGA